MRQAVRVSFFHKKSVRNLCTKAETKPSTSFLSAEDISFLQTNPLVGVKRANERVERVNDVYLKRAGKRTGVVASNKEPFDSYSHPFVTDLKAGIIFDQLEKFNDPVISELDALEDRLPNVQLEDTIELHSFINSVIEGIKATVPPSEQPAALRELQKECLSAAQKVQPQFNPPKFWQSELTSLIKFPTKQPFDIEKEVYNKDITPNPEHWAQGERLIQEAEQDAERMRMLEDPPTPDRI